VPVEAAAEGPLGTAWTASLEAARAHPLEGAWAQDARGATGSGETDEGADPPETAFPLDPELAPRPTGRAAQATGPIQVDGRLDEPSWAEAEVMSGFVQAIPDAGMPASEETEVRMIFDDEFLYIGALLHDSRPDLLVSGTLERDHPGISAHDIDLFGVFIDTFLDRRNGYLFLINPAGAVRDGQAFDNSRNLDFAWDAVVHVATRIHDGGWTVEMAIPWTTLRFDPTRADQAWGVNFHRSVSRRNERTAWAPLDRRHQIHFAERAGTVHGPESVPSGRNLRVKPFVLSQNGHGATLPDWRRGTQADGGVDLKWGLTPRLTMDLTWRADFSHVDVDQEQVNLSRFPLFFPERRDFFVENSGMFLFGEQSERNYRLGTSAADLRLFHSRRIGLEGGRPVPLTEGGRLTGQVGESEVGILHARTGAVDGLTGEAFSVARLRRQIFSSSDVGVLLTDRRDSETGAWNRAGGLDLNLRLGPSLLVSSYVARSGAGTGAFPGSGAEALPGNDPVPSPSTGDPWTGRLWIGWRDRLWDASVLVRQVGDAFDPGVGFVQRRAVRHAYATLGAHPRPPIPGVLDVNPYLEVHRYRALGGGLETASEEGGLGVNFQDGGELSLSATRRLERLEAGFDVEGRAFVEPGTYRFTEGRIRYQASRNRKLSASASMAGGGFFGGSRMAAGGGVRWMPDPRVSVEVRADHNRIEMDGERFTAALYSVRTRLARSTRFYLSGVAQYNQAQDLLVSNLRFTLFHAPLSEAFLVLTERRGVGPGSVTMEGTGQPTERVVTLKATRLLSF
jgi:hypothetical protein